MISDGVLIAGISAMGGMTATVVAQLGSALVKRRANGRLESVKAQNRFYSDLQKRLEHVESELRTANQTNIDLQRNQLQLAADLGEATGAISDIRRGIADLRDQFQEHLAGHPSLAFALHALEALERRTRWTESA